MSKYREKLGQIAGHILPWFVLAILLLYTYAGFFERPYLGFRLDSIGYITEIYADHNSERSLQLGDRLIQVGSLRWDDFKADLHKPFSSEAQPGQVISLLIERDHQLRDVSWVFPGPTLGEILGSIFNGGWLAYIFWFVGSLTLLNLRLKDELSRLMIAFNYLTAIWVIAGDVSLYRISESAIILRMVVWICVPVYLHMNWVFPKPFSKPPSLLMWGIYIIAITFAIAEWFQVLSLNLYSLGFLLAVGGSFIFIILHALLQPEVRRDLRLFIVMALLALLLPVVFGLISIFNSFLITSIPNFATWSLPILPFAYLYPSYRRQSDDLELPVYAINRFISIISIYVFLILLSVVIFPLLFWADSFWYGIRIFVEVTAVLFTAFISILGFPAFKTFFEQHLLDIRSAPDQKIINQSREMHADKSGLSEKRAETIRQSKVDPTVFNGKIRNLSAHYAEKPRKNLRKSAPSADESRQIRETPKVFISYCKEDFEAIKAIYSFLKENHLIAWMDQFDLLPGQEWESEINHQIKTSDFFIACLSKNSVSKRGFVQKELKQALAVLDEFPKERIYIIPIKLENCMVPDDLAKRQWLDWSHADAKEKLLKALKNE